ncbi:MAG TPA: toprim domain-containing protein, partial [Streptosporangiaceae bacterium]|nr:toprim domain-containing protein [Streptosporangiaceae bacterium]
ADLAKREIAQRRQAVVVEGYTDVMACHLAGVGTAVASCGTSFGAGHITILRRLLMDDSQFRGEVIFTFDGDAAGQRAAERAYAWEERFATQTFVAIQGDGLDPCDLRLARGDAAVRDLVAQRVPLFEFAIRAAIAPYNLETAEGKLAALDAAAPIVRRIKDKSLCQLYARSLDRWTGILDETFVVERVLGRADRATPGPARGRGAPDNRAGQGADGAGVATRPGPAGATGPAASSGSSGALAGYDERDPVVNVERQALKLAIQRPALCGPTFDALAPAVFTVPAHAAVRELLAASGGVASAHSAREWSDRLRAAAPNDAARAFVTRLAVEPIEVPGRTGEPDATFAEKVLAQVEELAVNREIVSLKSRLQRLSPVTEPAYNRMFGDLVALEQRHKVLLERATGGQ